MTSGWVYTSQLVYEGTKFSHYSEGLELLYFSNSLEGEVLEKVEDDYRTSFPM